MKKYLFLIIVFIFCISCGVTDRIELPLTQKEIIFFDELDGKPLVIDSVIRNISINRLMWHKESENVSLEIYSFSTQDSLSAQDWDMLSDQIANFYATQEIEGFKFTNCYIIYYRIEDKNGYDYYYDYDFKDGKYKLEYRPYEFEEKN